MTKRSFSSQLPAINQTEVWNKFFGATVDQVFQPGSSVSQIAYLGKKPPYNNPETDFYKVEQTPERSFYQLEPALTTKNNVADEKYSNLMFYQDLVNHLRFQGADVSDPNKLFSTEFYSWCPPVNVHKLTKYNEYYWMPSGPPVLIYDILPVEYLASGTQTKFMVPDTAVQNSLVDISVAVDGDNVAPGNRSAYYDLTGNAGVSREIFNLLPTVVYDDRNIKAFGAAMVGVIKEATLSAVNHMQDTGWFTGIDAEVVAADISGMVDSATTNTLSAYFERMQASGNLSGTAPVALVISTIVDTRTRYTNTALQPLVSSRALRISGSYITNIIKWVCASGDDSDLSKLVDCYSAAKFKRNYTVVGVESVQFTDAPQRRRIVEVWSNSNFEQYINGAASFRYELPGKSMTPEMPALGEIEVTHTPELIRGMHLMIRDNNYESRTWVVDVVDGTIKLVEPNVAMGAMVEHATPVYTTIERGDSRPQAVEWSSRNHWYHRSVVTFYDENYSPIRASRPIVEFRPGLEMHSTASFATSTEPLFEAYDYLDRKLSDSTVYPEGFTGTRIFGYKKSDVNEPDAVLGFAVEWNKYGSIVFVDEMSPAFKIAGVPERLRFYNQLIADSSTEYERASNWMFAGKTKQEKVGDFWELPTNLTTNPMNSNFSDISENDWYQHFENILEDNPNPWAKVNSEFVRNTGNIIIQSRNSLMRTMLFASSEAIDVSRAIAYNEREYMRFRAKFNQTLTRNRAPFSSTMSADIVDLMESVLIQLASTKSIEFPFVNSGVGNGEWYIPASGSFIGAAPIYTPDLFVDEGPESTTVSIRGHDGSITKGVHAYPKVVTTNDGITNVTDELVKVSLIGDSGFGASDNRTAVLTYRRTHHDLPADHPNKYENVQTVDQLVWARTVCLLEHTIYASAPQVVRDARRPITDSLMNRPAAFREAKYSVDAWKSVTRPAFEKWASTTGIAYRKNTLFNPNNRFTWNFRNSHGFDGKQVPGYWRGVYMFYLDTDRPHQTPWEMLGLTSKPMWWDTHYSWVDAGKRAAMVHALEHGFYLEPTPQNGFTLKTAPSTAQAELFASNCDSDFARPGIGAVLPVSLTGALLDPVACGIIPLVENDATMEWEYGDLSPIENMWLRSYAASYITSLHGYLMDPIQFVESNWLAGTDVLVNGEWLRHPSYDRVANVLDFVHNEVVDGALVRRTGIQMWVSDYLRSQGIDITANLGNKMRNIVPKLAHKIGGFVESTSLRGFTENIGALPSGDISTALYQSPSIKEEFYGGIIVEKKGSTWRVYGYDVVTPKFKILRVEDGSRRITVSASNSTESEPNEWMANTNFSVNTKVMHKDKAYRAIETHTSSAEFEPEYWVQIQKTNNDARLTVSWPLDFDETSVLEYEYGTALNSRQELADFIASYQAYLVSRGWRFETHDLDMNVTRDFKYSMREFLVWAAVSQLDDGMFIALSPASESVSFVTTHGTVRNVEQVVNGASSVLNREGFTIGSRDITANRTEDKITVGTTGDKIYGLRLYVNEVEHALVFNNTTVFGDVLYDPVFGLRQYRIRVSGNFSTSNWVGRMDCPGFVITDNTLIPNFDRQAEDIRYAFGIEDSINLPFRDSARHQIGYQSRSYLDSIIYNEANQFEFYQGMIQQKGAPGVFNKLMRNVLLRQNHTLNFLEEWAFRYGAYGGVDRHRYFEFNLASDEFKSNPQLVTNDTSITVDFDGDQIITLVGDDERWVKPLEFDQTMFQYTGEFTTHKAAMPSAGYARLTEVSHSFPNISSLNANKSTIGLVDQGTAFWLYHYGPMNGWSAFSASPISVGPQSAVVDAVSKNGKVVSLESTLRGALVGFDRAPDNIHTGDILYIGEAVELDFPGASGFYQVLKVDLVNLLVEIDLVIVDDKVYDIESDDCPEAVVLRRRRVSSLVVDDFKFVNVMVGDTLPLVGTNGQPSAFASFVGLHLFSGVAPTPDSIIDGEYFYIDVCYALGAQHLLPATSRRWIVVQYNAGTRSFVVARIQPSKLDSDAIADVKLFHNATIRTNREIDAKPLLTSEIVIWDPMSGLMPGVAQKEIKYKLEYDPAEYNRGKGAIHGSGADWGYAQVGTLWWDLSTTFYLEGCTNVLPKIPGLQVPYTAEQYQAHLAKYAGQLSEFKYRQTHWGNLAPSATVDIYEWTKSDVTPMQWQTNYLANTNPAIYDGNVMDGEFTNYVESTEWDARLNREVPVYFFWVKNRISTPRSKQRRISADTVSRMLTNPTAAGLTWLSPIGEQSFIVSNLADFADNQSTIEFKIKKSKNEVNQHVEWKLLRSGDERGLPDYYLWTRLVNSLVARNVWGAVIPDPELDIRDQVGYDVLERRQNMFKDIAGARKHLVQSLNVILKGIPIEATRSDYSVLNTEELDTPELQWIQSDGSYYVKPVPHWRLWGSKIEDASQLDHDLGDQLMYDLTPEKSSWSVMSGDLWDATFFGVDQTWGEARVVLRSDGSFEFTPAPSKSEYAVSIPFIVATTSGTETLSVEFFTTATTINARFGNGNTWTVYRSKEESIKGNVLLDYYTNYFSIGGTLELKPIPGASTAVINLLRAGSVSKFTANGKSIIATMASGSISLGGVDQTWDTWNQGTWDFTEGTEGWETFIWDGEVVTIAYNIVVETMASLETRSGIAIPVNINVLVKNTFGTGYWSLWKTSDNEEYDANDPNSLSVKFELVQMQRYRSSDIWQAVDWYAEGESSQIIPYVSFATAAERLAALGVNPTVKFVKMVDSRTGRWEWSRFVDGEWVVVARQLGTIQLLDNIWKNTGNFVDFPSVGDQTIYSPDMVEAVRRELFDKITNRDMGYELGFMLNTLRENVLNGLELNKMFFEMVTYAHTEQDFIDWCFKTSFMYITGYSDQLRQMPIKYADLTSSVLAYINEVKPYHVKIRDFISKYRAPLEIANTQVTDFDLPPYFDPKTGITRALDYRNADDLAVINSHPQYAAWKAATMPILAQIEAGVSSTVINKMVRKNGVRKLNITRGNAIDESVTVSADETVDLMISRSTVPTNHQGKHDMGVPFWRGAIRSWSKGHSKCQAIVSFRGLTDHDYQQSIDLDDSVEKTASTYIRPSEDEVMDMIENHNSECQIVLGITYDAKLTAQQKAAKIRAHDSSFCDACCSVVEYDDHAAYKAHHNCANPKCKVDGTNVKSYFPLLCDGTIDYSAVEYTTESGVWDEHIFDEEEYIHCDDEKYAQRYLAADPADTGYSGPFAGTPYDVVWNYEEPMSGLVHDAATDSYQITPGAEWYEATLESPYGTGMMLEPVRLLSAKKFDKFADNLVALHVLPKTGVAAKIRIVNKHKEQENGEWIFHSPGGQIYHPL